MNPYRAPDDGAFRIVNVSGGRSSAFMLWNILQAHGGSLPENLRAVFCNTGKEREETLVFVAELAERWGVDVAWLEYRHDPDAPRGRRRHYAVADFNTASRNGEPFEMLIRESRMLPTVVKRICTQELKVQTAARYARRELGWREHRNVIGFRYDEPARWKRVLRKGECRTDFPMVLAKATRADVARFWKAQPFDLGIPSERGNCDLCFLKGKRKLVAEIKAEPGRAAWWIAQEDWIEDWRPHMVKRENLQFRQRHSYRQLLSLATSNAELPFEEDAPMDCFCGD